jgi:hypothetical protein
MQNRKTFRPWLVLSSLIGLSFIAFVFFAALGPDRELRFLREIPSSLDPERLDRNISAVSRWPQWFFSTAEVQLLNSEGKTDQKLQKGSIVQLKIDPRKGERKRFLLTAEVTDYIPAQRLTLKILKDSTGRLNRLFDDMHWNIELVSRKQGSLIRGTITARTHHWRARLFGQMSEKILMNQIFYPNLIKLAELKQPFSMDQTSQSAGLFSP